MCGELLNALAGDADTSGVIDTRLLGLTFSFYLLHIRACSALARTAIENKGSNMGCFGAHRQMENSKRRP
jgi:hypothetical protein